MNKNIMRIYFFIALAALLIQCQANNKTGYNNENENFSELKELIKNQKNSGNNISFVSAAAISTPCVVHIKTKMNIVVNTISPFHDFFGNEFFYQQPRNQKQESSGSGVIIADDGYIVTNNHVIQNATEIEVTLRNKNTYKARVIGADKDLDIALIKIEEKQLPFIEIANSDSVMVGEWVLAVGNPFNLESTVTQGIVSAKGRALNPTNTNGKIESFIQTDAAVNPGNSGGALVNLNGQLIGINTAIASPTGAYAGYAFAVPSNLVKKVIEDIQKYGNVQRAFLGVIAEQLTSQKAKELKLPSPNGVLVSSLSLNGAAQQAGIQKGDVITGVNKQRVASFPELLEHINTHRPGDKVEIEYYRNGQIQKTNAILKNKKQTTELIQEEMIDLSNLGIEITPLTQQEKTSYQISSGVRVLKVSHGIISKQTQIKPGFTILSIGDKPISSEQDVLDAINSIGKGKKIIIEGFYPNVPYTYQYSIIL